MNANATVEGRVILCIILAKRVLCVCSSKASGSVMKATAGVSIQLVLYKFLVMFAPGLLFQRPLATGCTGFKLFFKGDFFPLCS